MIEVKHLTKQYGDHFAVDDLSFRLESGKIYGFLGPNGAGKSTTMNMMTGYISSSSGEVRINGHDILEEPEEAKKCIGYLPEIPPLYPDMTVMEYLITVAELKKIPAAQRKEMLDQIMETVKLTDMKNRLIRNLSKGYKQRVGIAQALVGYPQIVILDEPTVGLDPKQIIEIRDLIKSLGKKHTVILSSHILSEVRAVCEEVLIINKGKRVAFDHTGNLEKMFRGSSKLEMVVEASESLVREVLGGLEGTEYVEISRLEEYPDALHVTFQTKADTDVRREMFFQFAKYGCPILELHRNTVSLEEIFLELTASEENDQNHSNEKMSFLYNSNIGNSKKEG